LIGEKLEGLDALFCKHIQPFCSDLAAALETQQLRALDEVLDLPAVQANFRQLV
jgi:hypothetical protein